MEVSPGSLKTSAGVDRVRLFILWKYQDVAFAQGLDRVLDRHYGSA
jgi:hypothetical protein